MAVVFKKQGLVPFFVTSDSIRKNCFAETTSLCGVPIDLVLLKHTVIFVKLGFQAIASPIVTIRTLSNNRMGRIWYLVFTIRIH
jgi:hypothetical protein